jgi:radical SAM-linked protein
LQFGRSKKKVAPRSLAAAAVGRLRIRWGRSAADTQLSHLDNIREIESAIKRSGIPAARTQGVHPRLKLSFSPPLPVGFTSETEFVDITLDQPANAEMINKIRQEFIRGMELLEAKTVFSRSGSLSEQINRVEYTLNLENEISDLEDRLEQIIKEKSIMLLRKTKSGESEVDIRPAIYELKRCDNKLRLILGIGEGGYTRPTEVARLIFKIDDEQAGTLKFHRARLFRHTDDGRDIPAIEL